MFFLVKNRFLKVYTDSNFALHTIVGLLGGRNNDRHRNWHRNEYRNRKWRLIHIHRKRYMNRNRHRYNLKSTFSTSAATHQLLVVHIVQLRRLIAHHRTTLCHFALAFGPRLTAFRVLCSCCRRRRANLTR